MGSKYLSTAQVKDQHTGFIHNIEVWEIDDGFAFRIDWMPINLKEILEDDSNN